MSLDIIKEIVAKQFGIDHSTVTNESRLTDDFGADSLDAVEIVMAIEDRCKVEITDEEYLNCFTIGSIVELVEKKLNK